MGIIEAFAGPLIEIMNCLTTLNTVKKTKEVFIAETEVTEPALLRPEAFERDLILRNISLRRESFFINSFNFTFNKGKKYAVIGKNGSGKSTILDIAAKFIPPDGGNVFIDGNDSGNVDLSRLITYQCQSEHIFNADYTDNVTMFGAYTDEPGKAAGFNIKENIAQSKNCSELSGGEKQMVALMRSLNTAAPILLLDEPFSAADERTTQILLSLVTSLNKLVIMVTHFLNDGLELFDEVLIIENGNLVEHGKFDVIKNSGAYRRVRESLAADLP